MRKKLITLCLALTLAFSLTIVDTTQPTIEKEEHIIKPYCDLGDPA